MTLWYKSCVSHCETDHGYLVKSITRMADHRCFRSSRIKSEHKLLAAATNQMSYDETLKEEHKEEVYSLVQPRAFSSLQQFTLSLILTNYRQLASLNLIQLIRLLLLRHFIKSCNANDKPHFIGRCTSINFDVNLEEHRNIIERLYVNIGRKPDWQC